MDIKPFDGHATANECGLEGERHGQSGPKSGTVHMLLGSKGVTSIHSILCIHYKQRSNENNILSF